MGVLLCLIGIIGVIGSAIVTIVKSIKKLPKRRSVIALLISLVLLIVGFVMIPSAPIDESKDKNSEETQQEETSLSDTEADEDSSLGIRNEDLNGRGRADEGRNEPEYVGVIGYAVVASDEEYELKNTDEFANEDKWIVPTFEKDKQFWNETETTIKHKTEVVVREQELEHEGWGNYSGYLLVEDTSSGDQYYINVNNYITKPYWSYDNDKKEAALTGPFVAEFNQSSDYYPVDSGGEKVELEDGTKVLVTGIAGTTGKFDSDQNAIEATVWQDWKLGYGGVSVYFNSDDLKILY